jgi:hypothetical protein
LVAKVTVGTMEMELRDDAVQWSRWTTGAVTSGIEGRCDIRPRALPHRAEDEIRRMRWTKLERVKKLQDEELRMLVRSQRKRKTMDEAAGRMAEVWVATPRQKRRLSNEEVWFTTLAEVTGQPEEGDGT